MNSKPDTVSADITLHRLVEEHLPRHQDKSFLVVEDGRLAGCITIAQIKKLPREKWEECRVGEILSSCPDSAIIDPDTEVLQALSRMKESNIRHLLVIDDQKLVGTLALSDILAAFSAWMELEAEK